MGRVLGAGTRSPRSGEVTVLPAGRGEGSRNSRPQAGCMSGEADGLQEDKQFAVKDIPGYFPWERRQKDLESLGLCNAEGRKRTSFFFLI